MLQIRLMRTVQLGGGPWCKQHQHCRQRHHQHLCCRPLELLEQAVACPVPERRTVRQ